MEPLTEDEQLTLKTGAFGAVFLVSNAEPGMLSLVRESFAASGALGGASGVVKEALAVGPLPQLPRDSPLEIEATVLPALRRAMEILRAKSPGDVEAYRSVVLAAADRVAQADQGVSASEAAMIDKIRDALAGPA
jgi:hypothetical protein